MRAAGAIRRCRRPCWPSGRTCCRSAIGCAPNSNALRWGSDQTRTAVPFQPGIAAMECPFCAETIKDEATVCKHCSRDLRVVIPIVHEIQDVVAELDRLQRRLDQVNTSLAMFDRPVRFLFLNGGIYVVLPALLLIAAHYLVIMKFDWPQLYLRIASVIIPLPFGMAAYAFSRIGYRGAFGLGVLIAAFSVFGMLSVVSYVDGTPIVPASFREWRETVEYGLSIALSFLTGNILVILVLWLLPNTIASGGKPSAAAYRAARMLGQHVGEDAMRRRARRIQDLMQTVGPLAGVAATAAGSIYTGLKGMLGP